MGKRKHHKIRDKVKVRQTPSKKIFFLLLVCASALFLWMYFKKDTDRIIENNVKVSEKTTTDVQEQKQEPQKADKKELGYIEIVESCGVYFDINPCVNIRSGPGTTHASVAKIRNGVVLRTSGSVEAEGRTWYKIIFDEWVRYPERVGTDWYVAGEFVRYFVDQGPIENVSGNNPITKKKIVVDLSEQTLYAYDGEELFMRELVSTGLDLSRTPRGSFTVFRKTPTRYMQGPLPGISDQYYDLPGVPWNLYFTEQGGAIHGTYWHDNFGKKWSHGCVNLPPDKAKELYYWAEINTRVLVQD